MRRDDQTARQAGHIDWLSMSASNLLAIVIICKNDESKNLAIVICEKVHVAELQHRQNC